MILFTEFEKLCQNSKIKVKILRIKSQFYINVRTLILSLITLSIPTILGTLKDQRQNKQLLWA